MSSTRLKFSDFELDPASYELLFMGRLVKLERLPLDLLLLLTSRPGELVERTEIVEKLWGNDVFVETENGINTAIRKIRVALRDDPDRPRFVMTVPGRGYRFIAPVEKMAADQAASKMMSGGAAGFRATEVVTALDRRALSSSGFTNIFFLGKQKSRVLILLFVALVLGVVLYGGHRLRRAKVSLEKITHRQFTFVGNAYTPAISSDGMYVAYVMKMSSGEQKLMVQGSSGNPMEVARGAGMDSLRWSPDGSELLFTERRDGGLKGSLFLVSRLGGVIRPLVEADSACWFDLKGSQIVTENQLGPSELRGVRLMNKLSGEVKEVYLPNDEWLLEVDCSARTGAILLATVKSGKYQILSLKLDGSPPQKLLEGDGIYSPRWSPSGDAIYFMRTRGSTSELARLPVGAQDAEPMVLASGLQSGGAFSLASDGSRLAYTRKADNSNLWRISLPTSERSKSAATRLTSGTSYCGTPSFSPDGHWITFTIGVNGGASNIFKMPARGGKPVQLTFFEHATTSSPAYSPDGKRIAFISDQDGTAKVWIISADGGPPRAVENTNAADTNNELSWWPAPDIVYQQPGLHNLLQINDRTHAETPLLKNGQQSLDFVGRPIWSPDEKKFALTSVRENVVGLWIISPEPYSQIPLKTDILPLGWAPDGRYIYGMRGVESHEILRVQVGPPTKEVSIAALPDEVAEAGGGRVSADGKEAVVTISEEISDVWLMENFDASPSAIKNPRQ